MTSSTRIISKDDLSKSGKMKVGSREVGGAILQGKHKVTTKTITKPFLLTASREGPPSTASSTFYTLYISTNSGETSVESWKIFVSEDSGLIDTSSDIENAFDEITTEIVANPGTDSSTIYKNVNTEGVINAPFHGYHGTDAYGSSYYDPVPYYMYIILTIDGQKKFSVLTIPANSGTTQIYAYDEDSINLP